MRPVAIFNLLRYADRSSDINVSGNQIKSGFKNGINTFKKETTSIKCLLKWGHESSIEPLVPLLEFIKRIKTGK